MQTVMNQAAVVWVILGLLLIGLSLFFVWQGPKQPANLTHPWSDMTDEQLSADLATRSTPLTLQEQDILSARGL